MAVTLDKFSIRGYTAKMRSIDVFKCWPFAAAAAGEVSREEVESWLPPMTVPKFRWWSDELALLRSNAGGESEEGKPEMVCPVCCDFKAETLTAVNAHVDGCAAQLTMSKMKAPKKEKKKRSIAEIFKVEEEVEPPIETDTLSKSWLLDENDADIARFRWLSQRLRALRSNGESAKLDEGNLNSQQQEKELEKVSPVHRVFNAAMMKTAVNSNNDGGVMRRLTSNPKPKAAAKKRSIAEILTVATKIDTVVEVEEEEEEKSGYGSGRIKRKKSTMKKNVEKKRMNKVVKNKSKVGKRGVVPLNNKSKMIKKRKKKIKKDLFNNKSTSKKVCAYKQKVQNPVKGFRKPKDTFGKKKVEFDHIDASCAHEKKLGLSEEKLENVKNYDSLEKQQKAVSSSLGILKNHEHVSESNSSGIQDGNDSPEESHSDGQVPRSDRHVSFSGTDYILGPKKMNSFDETMFNVSSDSLASSSQKERSSGSAEGTENLEANRNDDSITIDIDKRKEVSTTVESKQFSDAPGQGAIGNFLKQCSSQGKSKHIEKSESLSKVEFSDNKNLLWFDRSNLTTLHCSPYDDISRPLSAFQAGQISSTDTQVSEYGVSSSPVKSVDRLGDSTFQFASMNTNANTMNTNANTRTSSYSASDNNRNERPKFPLHAYVDNDNTGRNLGGRPSCHTFSADMTDNSFLFPGWGKGSVRNNCMGQNYFGLPLNSHGELINFSSSGKVGMSKPETSCTVSGSLSGLPVNDIPRQSNQEYLCTSEKHIVHKTCQDRLNPFPNYPARLGVTELNLHERERTDIFQCNADRCSNVQPLDSVLNLMRNPFVGQNQHVMVSNHKGNEIVSPNEISDLISPSLGQPTMRLMGKDVPISRSSKDRQLFVSRNVWADEETRRRHCSKDAAKHNSSLGRYSMQDWVSGSQLQLSTENALQSEKIESNLGLQSISLMKGLNSEFLKLQSNHILRNGSLGLSKNAGSNCHHITPAPASCAVYNRAPDGLLEQFISGAKPQGFGFQSQLLPTPGNFSQPTFSNAELNEKKKHYHVTKSGFGFPFLHPVVEEQAKTPWFHSSYRSLPPRSMFRSTNERLPVTSYSLSFPQITWGSSFTAPSVNHSAEVVYCPDFVNHHCLKKTPLCPASVVQSPRVPVTPVTKPPPSVMNIGYRNLFKVTDRVKLDDMTVKNHHPCTNSRKRHGANLVDLTKPNKLPNKRS